MRELLKRLLGLFSTKEQKKLLILLSVTTFNGLIQALGIVSVMPFIALLTDPSLAESNSYLLNFKQLLPVSWQDSLLLVLGISAFAILVVGNLLVIFDYWLTLRFFNVKEYKISIQLLSKYLKQDLLSFSERKISEMSKNVLSEVDRVIIGSMLSLIGIISDSIIALCIVALLLYVNFWITVITSAILILAYALVYLTIIRKIQWLGEQFSSYESRIYSAIKQILELYKEAKVAGKSGFFIRKYSKPAKTITRNATRYHLLKIFPEQIIEIFAFGLIIFIALYFSSDQSNSATIISTIAFFAFAVYRLTPVLKAIFDGVEEFQYLRETFLNISKELESSSMEKSPIYVETSVQKIKQSISFQQVTFAYPKSVIPVFKQLTLNIPAKGFTCIIGASGIGKSTLLDLLLGLLQPDNGEILIDQQALTSTNLRSWQANIGYVPQTIQLLEDSIVNNIAFGIAPHSIDLARVKAVAKIAQIDRFIEENLADGYQHIIGDGGQIISGGQKQRIGIARSLYHDPQVLLLDEATNELDGATESEILSSLSQLTDKTIIFVSHKSAIVEQADQVIDLSKIIGVVQR